MLKIFSDPERNFIVVKNEIDQGFEVVSIHDIQPTEDILKKESVDYFLANPERIFDEKISITKSDNLKYKYSTVDGNNRLFVLFLLGFDKLKILPDDADHFYVEGDKNNQDMAEDTRNRGVTGWELLKEHLVPEEEYHRMLSERY